MNLLKGKKLLRIGSATILASSSLASLAFTSSASASPLTQVDVVFNNMQTSAFTAGTVCAKPTSTATEAFVDVTFPTGYTVSTTAANWAVSTAATATWPAGAAAWPTIAAPATAPTGQDVVFGSGDLTVGTLYCFNWTNTSAALKQPTSANASEVGSVTTQTSASATIDTSQFATATLTTDTVNVTATVPPIFNFAVAPNSDPLGTLSTSAISTSQVANRAVLTVNTNAKNGWTCWGSDANGGIKSTQANYTIASHTGTITTGQEFYNTGVFAQAQVGGTGTVTLGSGWSDAGNNGTGVGLTTTPQAIASSTGTADTSTLTIANSVSIKATTPAATDYADVQTYIAAGLF